MMSYWRPAAGWVSPWRVSCVFLFLLAGLVHAVQAKTPGSLYQFGPPAPWVSIVAASGDAAAPTTASTGSVSHLLWDRQVNITEVGDELYVRHVDRALSGTGVTDLSQINITVDPTYQTLRIHWIRVVRNGRSIDNRDTARITALAQESDSWRQIYNGQYDINMLLSDLRAGDVVDLAYSLTSRATLFKGHYAHSFPLTMTSLLRREHLRIRYPAARPLQFRYSDGSAPPQAVSAAGTREVDLDWPDRPGLVTDAETPAWYPARPYLQATDIRDWSGVSRRTEALFRLPDEPDERLKELVENIRRGGGSPEDQALRALQYVQGEIRYASIAIGPASYQPAMPGEVLRRRFGDCKDKSLLLVAALRMLGAEAHVALVNSDRRRALAHELPTPFAFNHAIVRATLGERVYWLDSTRPRQQAPLAVDAPADFERALLVDGTTAELEVIPRPAATSQREELEGDFLGGDDLQKPAVVTLKRRYFGALADETRAMFSSETQQQLQAGRINYLAQYYPSLQSAGPIETSEVPGQNAFEVRENYVMPHLFVLNDAHLLKAQFHPDRLYGMAQAPQWTVRTAPMELEFPIEIRQTITVHLPDSWKIKPEIVVIDNPAFHYRSEVEYSNRKLVLTYEYQSLRDQVAPEELERYLTDRRRVLDDLGFSLTRDPQAVANDRFAIAPVPFFVIVLALALGTWLAYSRVYRFDPVPEPTQWGAPVGIRGWLLLPALSIVATPLVCIFVVAEWSRFVDADMWYAIPRIVSPAYAHVAQAVITLGIALIAVALPCSTAVALLLFRKRSSVPFWHIVLMWTFTIHTAVFFGVLQLMGVDVGEPVAKTVTDAVKDFMASAVWTTYLLRSRRVKATFVRRREGALTNEPAPMSAIAPVPSAIDNSA